MFQILPEPIWVEITKKNCSLRCKNEECRGKLFWNDGEPVDFDVLNAIVTVSVVDPVGTTECSARWVRIRGALYVCV